MSRSETIIHPEPAKRYRRWKACYWGGNRLRWITVYSIDGTSFAAKAEAKKVAPPYWHLKELRPVWKSLIEESR